MNPLELIMVKMADLIMVQGMVHMNGEYLVMGVLLA